MTKTELLDDLERRRRDAEAMGSTAYVSDVLASAIRDIRQLDVGTGRRRLMKPAEVARQFAVTPPTVARWCRDGRFPGARKLDGGTEAAEQTKQGRWRIPSDEVDKALLDPTWGTPGPASAKRNDTGSWSSPPKPHITRRRQNRRKGKLHYSSS